MGTTFISLYFKTSNTGGWVLKMGLSKLITLTGSVVRFYGKGSGLPKMVL